MGERACPLRMVSNNEAISVLEKTCACIKDKCAWWLNPYKQEKGKETREGACAVVMLAKGGFPEANWVVCGRQAKSFLPNPKDMQDLIKHNQAKRGGKA